MPRAPVEARGRIAGERKYLAVLSVDLQRSTDLISDLDPEEAISRLEPAHIAMRTAVRRNRGIVSKEGGDGLIGLRIRRQTLSKGLLLTPICGPPRSARRSIGGSPVRVGQPLSLSYADA